MKAAKRKELVNELRNAHFYMGFDKSNNFFFKFKKQTYFSNIHLLLIKRTKIQFRV